MLVQEIDERGHGEAGPLTDGRSSGRGYTRPPMSRRVLVIGLDCAAPQLVFDRGSTSCPNIRALTERGRFGVLRSCDPPITVPAWSVMTSSRSPGVLGFYGFRNRKDHSYDALALRRLALGAGAARVGPPLARRAATVDRARRPADLPRQRR